MLLRVRTDEYLVATVDHRWHLRERLVVVDPPLVDQDEQELWVCPASEPIPVAGTMLYCVGEERLVLAFRAVPDINVQVDDSIWVVDLEEVQQLTSVFDTRVLLEVLAIDDQKLMRLKDASTAPRGLKDLGSVFGIRLVSSNDEIKDWILNG